MQRYADLRQEALAQAYGGVLEIGFGTGRNLPHYPPRVERLHGLDPLKGLRGRIEQRISRAPFPVERVPLAADGTLPFEEKSFDCVVTTWTLCSIARPVEVLRDVRRVLRPGGVYIFLEHGRSDDPRVARRQRQFNPIQRRIGEGCELDRPIDTLVRSAGLAIEKLDRFVHGGGRIFSEMYRGVAHP
jgi:ubiquinone/menaquinone biosynthesis C-methylase UbiE